jgi:adenylate cyclase
MDILIGHLIVSLIFIGVAWIFYRSDRKSPTTRVSALFLGLIGAAVLWRLWTKLPLMDDWQTAGSIIARSLDALATFVGIEWVRRVGEMVADQEGRRWAGGIMERFAQALVVVYWVLVMIYPELKPINLFLVFSAPDEVFHLAFWIHFIPQQLALWLTGLSILFTVRRNIDEAERSRLIYLVMSVPFLIAAIWWPEDFYYQYMPLSLALGLLIYVAGNIRYLIIQGQRATFMRRFMPKEVTHMVREKGFKAAIKPDELEISVVSCDIRGFTKYAAEHNSADVLTILHHYYEVVHEAADSVGGTVKDHAGDGVLTLLGAPVSFEDHRQRAEKMAQEIIQNGCAFLDQETDGELGLGIGIASGVVTTGAVGGSRRLEYVAVGSAVNMASRLCDQAANGEVLADVIEGEGADFTVMLKGYADCVEVRALSVASPNQQARDNAKRRKSKKSRRKIGFR